jgi:hypothetical protein
MLAYVHPISGSVILQVASAGILAAAFTFKSWWGKAKELAAGVGSGPDRVSISISSVKVSRHVLGTT